MGGLSFGDISHTKLGGADSFSDQLSCKYTVFLLTVFVFVTTTWVYIDEPISCFGLASWTGSQIDYINKLCWVSDTYNLPEDVLPSVKKGVIGNRINYYQWVALLMMGQAFLFYLPRPIWGVLNKKSGVAVSSITDAAIECYRKSDAALTEKNLASMTTHVSRLLSHNSHTKSRRSAWCGLDFIRRNGNYLVVAYIFTKTLYLANAIGQLFLLGKILKVSDEGSPEDAYHMYGFQILRKLFAGERIMGSKLFPRITLCHFNIKTLGNVQPHTVQCALPLNFFYEIIFIFLWFWIVLVAVVTAASLVRWIASALAFRCHVDSIHAALVDMGRLADDASRDATEKFVRRFLRRDGCFVLRLVGKNTSDVLKTELVCSLWDLFVVAEKSGEQRSMSQKIAALMVDGGGAGDAAGRGMTSNPSMASAPSFEASGERARNKSGNSGLYVEADQPQGGASRGGANGFARDRVTVEINH